MFCFFLNNICSFKKWNNLNLMLLTSFNKESLQKTNYYYKESSNQLDFLSSHFISSKSPNFISHSWYCTYQFSSIFFSPMDGCIRSRWLISFLVHSRLISGCWWMTRTFLLPYLSSPGSCCDFITAGFIAGLVFESPSPDSLSCH